MAQFEIHALAPKVVARREDDRRDVDDEPLRLLATIVGLRRPAPADQVAELLWPDVAAERSLERLAATVAELGAILDAPGTTLAPDGVDGLVGLLPADSWWVDTWEFRRGAEGSVDDKQHALALYRGDFCGSLFPDDDVIALERLRLRQIWGVLALDLLDAGAVAAEHLADSAMSLQMTDPVLVERLSSALVDGGQTAEAETIRTALG